ncbi:MAG: ComF family protein [Alphaproteobacteria bacterium]|nr:ComF family protein [Alphaproteobacteria bacterium]
MVKCREFFRIILNFIYPPVCPLCNTGVSIHGEFCADCWTAVNWIDGAHCAKCGYPFVAGYEPDGDMLCPTCAAGKSELDWIRSACVYDDASKQIMLPFKHAAKIKYARAMANAMIWALRDVDVSNIDIVMPVPLAWRRLFHRGYNQASLLARPIARAIGVKLDYDSVRRKYRPDMGHKTARQRAENIRGVFRVMRPDKIRGKHILLVDDVMTSGATFSELRRVLMRAGAASVSGVSFCRVAHGL